MGNPYHSTAAVSSYEKWYTGHGRRTDRLEKRLLSRLLFGFPHGSSVFEVGCGTGHFTRWLAARGFQAVGLDSSPLMLAEAGKNSDLPFLSGGALNLPIADCAFDLVALITTLEFGTIPDGR